MKTKLCTVLLLSIMSLATAQENICAEKEKQFRDFIANQDYSNANLTWLEVREKCATYNENLYALGNQVLNYNIEIAPTEKKEEAVRDLLKMFKKYDAVFPQNSNSNAVKSAMALYANNVGTKAEIYSFLDTAFNKHADTFSDPQALYLYFKYYYDNFKEGKSTISEGDIIEKYSAVNGLVFQNIKKYPEKSAEYNRVAAASKALIGDLLTCDNLTPYFEKSFEKNKDNSGWLTAAATIFSEKCITSKTFEKVALQLYAINPSTDAAYFLGEYYLNAREQSKALDYFDTSVKLASGSDKAKKAYTIASIVSNSDKAKSKQMITLAIQNDASNGKYFLFLANLYANSISECGATPQEQAAIYKLAAITVEKAGTMDSRFKASATKTAADYLSKIDQKYKGKSVKINCWINETVQL